MTNSFSQTNFRGSWGINNDTTRVFSLLLNQTNNTITGNHCGTAYSGTYIDCSDGTDGNSISGIVQGDSAIITFFSTYCNHTGKAIIKKISSTQIQWRVTQKPEGGVLYLPINDVLNLETDPGNFTIQPGYTLITSSITSYWSYASFYLVFFPTSTMSVGTSYRVATVSENCRPLAPRVLSLTTGGRTWSVTINPNGDVYATIVSGSAIIGSSTPTNDTVVPLATLTYNF